MQTYFLRRRGIAAAANELDAALTWLRFMEERSAALRARWLHSYALREADGRFGLGCLFEADSVHALRRYAASTGLPAEEILPVTATQVERPFAPTMVYLVRRRQCWKTANDLGRVAARSRRIGDGEMATRVSWLRTYAVRENDGTLGTLCLYQSVDAAALAEHAARAGMPADEITPVIGRIVFRAETQGQPTASGAASN